MEVQLHCSSSVQVWQHQSLTSNSCCISIVKCTFLKSVKLGLQDVSLMRFYVPDCTCHADLWNAA